MSAESTQARGPISYEILSDNLTQVFRQVNTFHQSSQIDPTDRKSNVGVHLTAPDELEGVETTARAVASATRAATGAMRPTEV